MIFSFNFLDPVFKNWHHKEKSFFQSISVDRNQRERRKNYISRCFSFINRASFTVSWHKCCKHSKEKNWHWFINRGVRRRIIFLGCKPSWRWHLSIVIITSVIQRLKNILKFEWPCFLKQMKLEINVSVNMFDRDFFNYKENIFELWMEKLWSK